MLSPFERSKPMTGARAKTHRRLRSLSDLAVPVVDAVAESEALAGRPDPDLVAVGIDGDADRIARAGNPGLRNRRKHQDPDDGVGGIGHLVGALGTLARAH